MVNPKTIDSVAPKVIQKEPIVLDSQTEKNSAKPSTSQSGISCRKRKKERVMDAIDRRVSTLPFWFHLNGTFPCLSNCFISVSFST